MFSKFSEISTQTSNQLLKELQLTNMHQSPRLVKVVLNMGVKDAVKNSKSITNAANELALIAGQKPVVTSAKHSIAGFSLRKGMKIGCKVTLRRKKMYEFLERLVIVALPRVKDFQGFSTKNFDGMGNLNFGVAEQIVFPEIEYDQVDAIRGLNISIITSSPNNIYAKKLLEKFYLPFYD